jgi:DNA-binding NarL/FixJ family response regulator
VTARAPGRPLKVLVVDDHPVVLEGLRGLLATMPDVEVVGLVGDGAEAVAVAAGTGPDVVIMDLGLPGLDGFEAISRISAAGPATAVLVLTMSEDAESLSAAVRAGARGYLVKGATHEQITHAVRTVADGQALFGNQIAERALAGIAGRADKPLPGLSTREREMLGMLIDGATTNDIARALFVSPKTVRNTMSRIFGKLGAKDRAHAVALALRAGFTRD